jgi:N-acetylglucosamine-6-phosphate deacetylase
MGFFDLQVNGYAGVDLNGDESDAEAMERMCSLLTCHGVDGILVTLITDSVPKMQSRLERLVRLRRQHPSFERIIRGVHMEGPFINPADGYRGAHPIDAVLPGDVSVMKRLLEAGEGLVRLVTLAPECDPGLRVTRLLAENKITISAGHTDAPLEVLSEAIDAGLTMFTHCGNGCPAVMPRHDNILQRALSLRSRLWLCFIADGAHIPLFALKNYLDLVGIDHSIVVTDGISAAGLGPGTYQFGRWRLVLSEDLVARSPDGSHLVGSTTTMQRSFEVLTQKLHLSEETAWKLLSENPRRAIGEPLDGH